MHLIRLKGHWGGRRGTSARLLADLLPTDNQGIAKLCESRGYRLRVLYVFYINH